MQEKEGIKQAEKRVLDTLNYLKKQKYTQEQISEIVGRVLRIQPKEEVKVPISVFKSNHLGSLETIVKYLRENLFLTFRQIGTLTNRNQVALAVTYRNAKKKAHAKFAEEVSPYSIPVSILQDRKLSVLENISSYLKDTFGLTYHAVAVLLNRDDRTIWTVYQRAKKKRK